MERASAGHGAVPRGIEAWLKVDEQAPRKQCHTAKRIYERLREEFRFTGSERRVRELVASFKKKQKEGFLPLGFEPREMAQVDCFEEATVFMNGERWNDRVPRPVPFKN